MTGLLLALALAAAPAAKAAGDECDRLAPRGSIPAPDFSGPAWNLVDEGMLEFRYRFYARALQSRVTALVVEGERAPSLLETKVVWEENGQVYTAMLGAVADSQDIPICVRAVRGEFNLERLYQSLKPKLHR